MKNFRSVIILLFFTIPVVVAAQETEGEEPAKKMKSQDQLLLDFTFEYWMDTPDSVELEYFSRGFNLSLMYDLPLGTSNFSFAIGAGLHSHNIFSNSYINEYQDTAGQTVTDLVPYPENYSYKYNKVSVNYADIPLEFRFRSNENKYGQRFKATIGGKVGYMVQVHTKMRDDNGKFKGGFNLENFTQIRYGAVVRFGYGKVGLFAFYSLTPLFENSNQKDIIPFSAGFTLAPF